MHPRFKAFVGNPMRSVPWKGANLLACWASVGTASPVSLWYWATLQMHCFGDRPAAQRHGEALMGLALLLVKARQHGRAHLLCSLI